MKNNVSLISIFSFIGLWFLPLNAATISGKVTWQGAAPKLRTIDMSSDPVCVSKHKTPAKSQALVLGKGNTVGNIFVWVKSGLPAGQKYDVPSKAVVINQEGCLYSPHVVGLQTGQKIQFLNNDGILHNVHALPKKNRPFNISMPATLKESKKKKFKKEEVMFKIKCDVHPWMSTYVGVLAHPFFAVTKKDGKFTISNLPAGTYEVVAWHEKAGMRTAKITVAANDTKATNFTFSK